MRSALLCSLLPYFSTLAISHIPPKHFLVRLVHIDRRMFQPSLRVFPSAAAHVFRFTQNMTLTGVRIQPSCPFVPCGNSISLLLELRL